MAATVEPERLEIRPQSGPQELFLSTPADIAIIGGSVYGGKTWSLTCEPIRHKDNPRFTFVAFRRTTPEIRNPGGMWDESMKLYPLVGAEPRVATLDWLFPSGARGKMAGLQYETDVLSWKGAQIALLLFDQLEEFSEHQFFYLLSRNRSTCGVRPYCRGSCNPDPDSFLATFLAWWIDHESGYAIPERSGVVRWFIRVDNTVVWAKTNCPPADYRLYRSREASAKAELAERFGASGRFAKSVTFVLARLQDNKIGNALDPGYEANVRALSHVEQERLLGGDRGGNWKIRASAGLVFNRAWFEIVDAAPAEGRRVRWWDKAATAGGGDWTAGVKMSERGGIFYVEDVRRGQWGSGDREKVIKDVTVGDHQSGRCTVGLEQEPGAGGKDSAYNTIKSLQGYHVIALPATGDKVQRANPFAAQAQVGNVKLVRGAWTEDYLRELHAFPTKGVPDDQVDASSGAFNHLALRPPGPSQAGFTNH